jgi:hypothetical protein
MRETARREYEKVRDPETILAAEEFQTNPPKCSMNKLIEDDFKFTWHLRTSCGLH